MKKITVFGCGWVGKALIPMLATTFETKASVQSQTSFDKLQTKNKFLLNSKNNFYHKDFFQTDTLIIAIPPRDHYEQTIKSILNYLDPSTHIILLSSTSIYSKTEGLVDENSDKNLENISLMLKIERFIQKKYQNTLILRLGGLMGYDRIAGQYSAGKTLEHDAPVNYIHRDDVVAIIKHLIDLDVSHDTINIVAPMHPCKKEIYHKNAKQFGFAPTIFQSDQIKGKRVSALKLQKKYHYRFLKPDPLDFW